MLRRYAAAGLRTTGARSAFCRSHSSLRFDKCSNSFRYGSASLAASVVLGAGIWHAHRHAIHNENGTAFADSSLPREENVGVEESDVWSDADSLNTIVWGSNQFHILSPSGEDGPIIRKPSVSKWLNENVALRDLALHEQHAACADASGDVYQWGDSFFDDSTSNQVPALTLRGKDIVHLEVTEHRVFGLSKNGDVYSFSAHQSKQQVPLPGNSTPAKTSWWPSWLWQEENSINCCALLMPNVKLARGEKFISIAAGNDHVLALTSKGRTFAHAFNERSNAFGQLGFRQFDVPDLGSSSRTESRIAVELVPKTVKDPHAQATPHMRSGINASGTDALNARIGHSDRLFEIPSLRGIKVAQIAAGGRTSFARTDSGRVLGWGANEYGQIGLGSNVTLSTIIVPTEVVLWRGVSSKTQTRCLNVTAGGDLTCFSVERVVKEGNAATTVDVLMCGNGQWGGLGNNVFSNAQGNPVRAKNVSGLVEYSEDNGCLEPIEPHSISVSPTGHVLLTLDTIRRAGAGVGGRDLMVWGSNQASELGNQKKASQATATNVGGSELERVQLRCKTAGEVRRLDGTVWRRRVAVEQSAATGHRASAIYWKIR